MITADHRRFVDAGDNLSKAKEFNNAIREPLLPIPIDHVRNIT